MVLAVLGCVAAAPAKLDGLDHHHDHHHHHEDALAAPSRTGYDYEPPAQPSGLYETPNESVDVIVTQPPTTTTTTTTTATTTTPPPPPPSSYLPPEDELPESSDNSPSVLVSTVDDFSNT